MQDNLSVTYIQHYIEWKDRQSNLDAYDRYLDTLTFTPDLILLPETFNVGFCIDDLSIAERMDGPSVKWMKERSAALGSVVAGSIFIEDGEKYYNRFLWMEPDGKCTFYNKRHLFGMGREHELYTPGSERKVVNLHGWKICLNVCYDLRFPVWSRNDLGYDLLIYIANWPTPRANAWRDLLKARAIENMSYCIGVNRIGTDGYGNEHQGDSAFISPLGEVIYTSEDVSEIAKYELSSITLKEIRSSLPFLRDMDQFQIKIQE